MDISEASKASNAVVAVVDFYGTAVGDLARKVADAQKLLGQLSEHSQGQVAEIAKLDQQLKLVVGERDLLLRAIEMRLSGELTDESLRRYYERIAGEKRSEEPEAAGGRPGDTPREDPTSE